ncbi:hypothetical protein B0E49_18400 [Polaromonas sp. C04]|nr:hypothetical protein B0E49_18400 [Polaromonas sp. C04]
MRREIEVKTNTTIDAPQLSNLLRVGLLAFTVLCTNSASAEDAVKRAEVPTIKVGDRWKYEQADRRTGVKDSKFDWRITAVTASQIEGTENEGTLLMTPDLSIMESSTSVVSGEVKTLSFPLEVGKKWAYKASFANKVTGSKGRWELKATVVAFEKVKVPAGEFDAFKVEYKGFWNSDTTHSNGRLVLANWYAPATRSLVKTEYDDGYNNWVRQLVEFQLQP